MTSRDAIGPPKVISQVLVVVAQSGYPTTSDLPPDWTHMIPENPTAAWPWSTTGLWYSVESPPEVERQDRADPVGIPSTTPSLPLAHGWDLLPGLMDALLVHICRPYTRAGEVALMAAKALGKRTVLSDLGQTTSTIGASFGMETLADCVICESEEEGKRYSNHPRLVILDLTSQESWPALSEVYAALLGCGTRSK